MIANVVIYLLFTAVLYQVRSDGVTPSWYVRLGHTCRCEQGYDQTERG